MGRSDLIGNTKDHLVPEFNSRLEKRGNKVKAKTNDFHHRIKTKSAVKTKGKARVGVRANSKPVGKNKNKRTSKR